MSADELNVETLLRAHAPYAPERLRARVAALEPAPARRWSLPPRRLALVVLPAAAGIAVAVALVHGAVRPEAQQRAVTNARSAPALATQGGEAADSATLKAAAPSVQGSRLAHTDASLELRVDDTERLADATTRATRIATSLGGYAKSVDYSTPRAGAGSATLDLRVPAQNVKTALARLAELGTIVSQRLSVSDLEGKLATQSAQIAQLRRRVAALREALQDPALPEGQRVLLQIRLAEAKRALAQRLHARKGTLAAGATARISLVIGTEHAIVVPQPRGRFDRMLHSAVGFLALEGTIALYALIVASPLALVAALVWWLRRRSVERLLAA